MLEGVLLHDSSEVESAAAPGHESALGACNGITHLGLNLKKKIGRLGFKNKKERKKEKNAKRKREKKKRKALC